LGGNFSLPAINTTRVTTNFIVNHENNLSKLPPDKRIVVRNRFANIINSLPSYRYPLSKTHKELLHLNSITKKFLKENLNLIVTRADKGNVTVALDRDKYILEIEKLLKDETYVVVNKNPINRLISSLRALLTKWKNKEYIIKIIPLIIIQ